MPASRAYVYVDTLRQDGPECLSVSATAAAMALLNHDTVLKEEP